MGGMSFEAYVNRMGYPGFWGSQLELMALCKKHNVNALVHQVSGPTYEMGASRCEVYPAVLSRRRALQQRAFLLGYGAGSAGAAHLLAATKGLQSKRGGRRGKCRH